MIECRVEDAIPLPTAEDLYYTVRERATAACKTAEVLRNQGAKFAPEDRPGVAALLKASAGGIETTRQQHQIMSNPANAIMLREILSQYDMQVVQNAEQVRRYVTNRLIMESTDTNAKVRISALKLLGQISDVALFTERTEVTIKDKSSKDLEELLRQKLENVAKKLTATDATYVERTSDE